MQLESDDEEEQLMLQHLEDEGLAMMEDRTGAKEHRIDNNQVQDMEEESSDSGSDSGSEDDHPKVKEAPAHMQPPPMAPQADKVVVKKYDPKQGKRSFEIYCGVVS